MKQHSTDPTQCMQDRRQCGPSVCTLQLALLISLMLMLQPAQAAGVQATGATTTQVKITSTGKQQVTPAATVGDVSYNAFSSFDVNKAGVDFMNADVRARTIVAAVFSPLPSRIEGPVGVDGPRANLILANQNGVRVNGGSFVNFGSIALTTGAVTLRDEQLAPGYLQRYVDLAVRQGDIQIEAGGLEASVIRLKLIAKKVGIDGPITNLYSSATATTQIIAGSSDVQFDTAASPTDNLTPWTYQRAAGASVVDGIAVDLTANARVTSGRIEILVLDQGAGVRNAGKLSATANDFILTTSGEIAQTGGQIQAADRVRIQGASFSQTVGSLVAAGSNARIDVTGDISNIGGMIRGASRNNSDTETPYAVMLTAGGAINHRSAVGFEPAVVFGSNDDVGLFAKGDITSANARIVSNGRLTLQADGDVRNESLNIPDTGRAESKTSGLLTRNDGYTVQMGSLVDPVHQGYWVSAGDLVVKGRNVSNIGANVFSNNGSVLVTAVQTIRNEALATGSFDYQRSCFLFLCRRSASTTEALVGGQISGAGGVGLKAGQSILNDGGSVLGIGDIHLDAPQITARAKSVHQLISRADGVKATFGDTWAGIYAVDQGGGFTSQQGKVVLRGAARQERGFFAGAQGVEGSVEIIQLPQRDPVTLENHLGIFSW